MTQDSELSQEAREEALAQVFALLEFEPNVREAQIHIPPAIDELDPLRMIGVDWYHDPGDGKPRRWGWRMGYHKDREPDSLTFRRFAAFNAAAMFVPWASRLGFLRALYDADPTGTWQDAVVALLAQPIIRGLAEADKGGEDAAEWQASAKAHLNEAQKFVSMLQDELAFRAAVLEVQKVTTDDNQS